MEFNPLTAKSKSVQISHSNHDTYLIRMISVKESNHCTRKQKWVDMIDQSGTLTRR